MSTGIYERQDPTVSRVATLTRGAEGVGCTEVSEHYALGSHGIQIRGLFGGLAKHPQVPPSHLRMRRNNHMWDHLVMVSSMQLCGVKDGDVV